MRLTSRLSSGLAIAVVTLAAPRINAQANYVEGFEAAGLVQSGERGPDGPIADGWIFRNQSNPVCSGDWTR